MPRLTRAKTRASKRGVFKWPDLTPESLMPSPFLLPIFRDTRTRKLQENAQLRVALLMSKQQDVATGPKVNSKPKSAKFPLESDSSVPLQSGINKNTDGGFIQPKIVEEDKKAKFSTSMLPPKSSSYSTNDVVVLSNRQRPSMKVPSQPSAPTTSSQKNVDPNSSISQTKNRCHLLPPHSRAKRLLQL